MRKADEAPIVLRIHLQFQCFSTTSKNYGKYGVKWPSEKSRAPQRFKNYLGVDLEGASFLQFAQGHARGPKRHQKFQKGTQNSTFPCMSI